MPFLSQTRNLYYIGLLLIIITAWFSVGYHHPDEHYQILEFAKYRLGEAPLADLPWEFHEQMRPGLQPFLAYCTILVTRAFGLDDPFLQVFLMRLMVGLTVFWLYWKWCEVLSPTLRDGGRLLRLSLVFFWMMPYLNVRFSSENMSAVAFFAGLLLIYPKPAEKSGLAFFGAGLLLCLSFFFRYQIAFAGIGLAAWLLFQNKIAVKSWLFFIAGVLAGAIPGLITDCWLYGHWVLAPHNYFVQNIVEEKAAGFGVSPWYWYFTEMPIFFLPPVSLFLFWFMGSAIRKSPGHVFVWCLVPFVLIHSMIGHKETRFMVPMIFPMFYLAAWGWDQFTAKGAVKKWIKVMFVVAVVVNAIALLFRSFYPANDLLPFTRFMRDYAAEHPAATIYWEKGLKRQKYTLTPNFYQLPWMKIEEVDSLIQMNDRTRYHPKSGDLIYYKSEKIDFTPIGFEKERVYDWYPAWLLELNVNNWRARTRIWSVYQLK